MENKEVVTRLNLDATAITGLIGTKNPAAVGDMFISHAEHLKTLDPKTIPVGHRRGLGYCLYRNKGFMNFLGSNLNKVRKAFFPIALYLDLSHPAMDNYQKVSTEVLLDFLLDCSKEIKVTDLVFRKRLGLFIRNMRRRFQGEPEKEAKLAEAFFPVALYLDFSKTTLGMYEKAEPAVLVSFLSDFLKSAKAEEAQLKSGADAKNADATVKNEEKKKANEAYYHLRDFLKRVPFALLADDGAMVKIIDSLETMHQMEIETLCEEFYPGNQKISGVIVSRENARYIARFNAESKETAELRTIGANSTILQFKSEQQGKPVAMVKKARKKADSKKTEKK